MQLPKARTGIKGLDELTGGGLPRGRPTLLCGGAGCGKTLLAMEFLIHGALKFDEPGVFMAFEETAADLTANVSSLGFDLDDLVARRLLAIDDVRIDTGVLRQSGDYDLEGLFIRLGLAIDSVGAKRVVLDTIESLFSGLPNDLILRAELRRLFRWLKDRGVTAIITGERGTEPLALTRNGLEEYVSDCVIALDHRVTNMVSSRRLRVVKFRGSTHGTNEYPFLIDEGGFSVLPVTSLGLQHLASDERVPSGVPGLDAMLGGAGFFRGSSVMVSGTAGTGKSSLAAHFAAAACERGERVLYFAFEESAAQITRNMASIGIDLAQWVEQGLLQFHAARPTLSGLEMHLATMLKEVGSFSPQAVVLDPLNSFVASGNESDVKMLLLRLVDALKLRQITGFLTSLTPGGVAIEKTDVEVSSLIDTWVVLRQIESGGERTRALSIVKSRGMPHSNQLREFAFTGHGFELRDAYAGADGGLSGAARSAQEARDRALLLKRMQAIELKKDELAHKRTAMEAQIAAMRAELLASETIALGSIEQSQLSEKQLLQDDRDMAMSRRADAGEANGDPT